MIIDQFDYASVASGIEAATVAWHPLGWNPVFFSEINPFCRKVLKHHWPDVPNLGDMTKLLNNKHFHESTFNVLVGGTPCQSFSIAGLRGGMADERGNLSLTFCKLLLAKRPQWFVWENVPGVFSSFSDEAENSAFISLDGKSERVTQTSDFATLLQGFQECGYSVCWRVLDSQFFGVPQRRRRVFVVGYLGNDWRPPFAVLFEREGLRRDITPSEKAREEIAGTLDAGAGRRRGAGINPASIVPFRKINHGEYKEDETASALKKRDYKDATDLVASIDCRNMQMNEESSATIQAKNTGGFSLNYINPVIYPHAQITSPDNRSNPQPGDPSPTLSKGAQPHILVSGNERVIGTVNPGSHAGGFNGQDIYSGNYAFVPDSNQYMVRRLTPYECEKLQGFSGIHTAIEGASDSARYQSIGNSMTTFVMRWIGQRIQKVQDIINKTSRL